MRRLTLDWKPIETAPKDCTVLLCVRGYEPSAGCWVRGRWMSFDPEGRFESDAELDAYLSGTSYQPTHWHPLPLPPEDDTP